MCIKYTFVFGTKAMGGYCIWALYGNNEYFRKVIFVQERYLLRIRFLFYLKKKRANSQLDRISFLESMLFALLVSDFDGYEPYFMWFFVRA